LARNDTLHFLTISIIVNHIETIFIEQGGKMSLSHGKTNTIPKSLAKGASGNLDT